MNKEDIKKAVDQHWEDWFVKGLGDFVRVPNLTPMVDTEYLTNGKLEQAIDLVDGYIKKLEIQGLSRQIFKAENGMPLITYVVEPTQGCTKNVMVYGHIDKQPYGEGWDDDKKPTEPVIIDGCMYGRGSGDDGYSAFTCMLSVKVGQQLGLKMPRICLVIEAEEESGSPNLIPLLVQAKEVIGTPDVCMCMDSGAFDYNQLWMTSSLRGICILDLTVQIGKAGYHSGEVGGIVPETFRVVRQLLDRLDDSATGKPLEELSVPVPDWKMKEAEYMAKLSGSGMYEKYAVVDGAKYCYQDDLVKMYLNNQWMPNLSITGAGDIPPINIAGNVVRQQTSVRISMRLPPTMDPHKAEEIMRKKLTENVPYNAKVTIQGGHAGSGWCMKELQPWLDEGIKQAAQDFYETPAGSYGMGGSIPFLSELEKMYPTTQIVALGVLGPNANAHGPNEMINLPYTKKLTCSLASIFLTTGQQ